MLALHRPVCLSLTSTDLGICSRINSAATLYQRDQQPFHLVVQGVEFPNDRRKNKKISPETDKGLLWLEISPSRIIMTMQGKGYYSYRHHWEKGLTSRSYFWFNSHDGRENYSFRLGNFTQRLLLEGKPLPKLLHLDYELGLPPVLLGQYSLSLEIYH